MLGGFLPIWIMRELVGGEKQIIVFASIYAMSPQVYVLDEPSSNLDIQATEKVRKILSLLKQQGKNHYPCRTLYGFISADRAAYSFYPF